MRQLSPTRLVVKSTQHGFATHSVARRKSVSMLGAGRGRRKRGRYPRSQTHVNSAMVVMQDPTAEKMLEMPLAQRNEEIQAFPADGSDYTFELGIGLGVCRQNRIRRHQAGWSELRKPLGGCSIR